MPHKTAKQTAIEEIKKELLKEGKCFVAFGTFVDNSKMLEVINEALKKQREASNKPKPNFITSSWIKSIKFKYEDEYYYVTRNGGICRVYAFNGGIINSKEVLFEEETNPEQCMHDFMDYMERIDIAFEEMGGDWEG